MILDRREAEIAFRHKPRSHSIKMVSPNSSPFFGGHSRRYKPMFESLDSFTFFPLLPYELREHIWKFAAQLPRVIPLIKQELLDDDFKKYNEGPFNYREGPHNYGLTGLKTSDWTTIAKPPAILSCCHESRTTGLAMYKLCFGLQMTTPVYFSPENDIVLFAGFNAMESFFGRFDRNPENFGKTWDRNMVRNLAYMQGEWGRDSFEDWVQKRHVSCAADILHSLEFTMFVSIGKRRLDRWLLERLIRPDGSIANAMEQEIEREDGKIATLPITYTEPVDRPLSSDSWSHLCQ